MLWSLSEHGVIVSGFYILLWDRRWWHLKISFSFGRVALIKGLHKQECGLCLLADSPNLFSLGILKIGANKHSNLIILYETFILLPLRHESTFYSKSGNPCPLLFSWLVSTEPFPTSQTPGMSRKVFKELSAMNPAEGRQYPLLLIVSPGWGNQLSRT